MGFVIQHLGWPWVYWILAIVSRKYGRKALADTFQINLIQFLLYLLFSPETLYNRNINQHESLSNLKSISQYGFNFGRIAPTPLKFRDFIEPLLLLGHATILLPVIAYAVVFNFTLVMMTVEIPALLGVTFGLSPQQTGLNFLGMLVGYVSQSKPPLPSPRK